MSPVTLLMRQLEADPQAGEAMAAWDRNRALTDTQREVWNASPAAKPIEWELH